MSKLKPNAAQITSALAKLGGGPKKDGGGGMLQGIKNIFDTGYTMGSDSNKLTSVNGSTDSIDKK